MSDNQLFKPEERSELQRVLSRMNREQLLWLGGYISAAIDFAPAVQEHYSDPIIEPGALTQGSEHSERQEAPAAESKARGLTILFGSHSGNSEKTARLAQKEAERKGLSVKVKNMEEYNARFLKEEEQVLVVVSTHGEGEPPLAAQELHEKLAAGRGFDLSGLSFAVIALGDSSYKHFCKTGHDFADFFKKLGAKSLREVAALDTDFENELPDLLPAVIDLFSGAPAGGQSPQAASPASGPAPGAAFSSNQPVEVEVLERIQLNGRGSEKETWHLELATDKTGLVYQPGDALEVFANNDPRLVAAILAQSGLDGTQQVEVRGKTYSLEEALRHHYELTVLTAPVVRKYAALQPESALNQLLEDPEQLGAFMYGSDVLDLLKKHPLPLDAGQLLSVLRYLPPRAYSIASSPAEVGDEIHLTVGAVRYQRDERERGGVCSTFLADRLPEDGRLKVKVKPNNQFKLPANDDTAIIMVGAGTGIAPFRGFLQHRSAKGSKGKNWLFFGDQHFTTDFLYQSEWQKYRKSGLLTRLDVAFSRDQEEKRYVQHRMKRQGKDLFKWLSEGAHFYVCGDMKRMAGDVSKALLDILQIEGNMSREESEAYLARLRKEKRYQEDVY